MASFPIFNNTYAIGFRNHSNAEINWDLRRLDDHQNFGNVAPGTAALSNSWQIQPGPAGTPFYQFSQIPVIGIGQFGQSQLVPAPGVRFSGIAGTQFINLLAGNGWQVTQDTPSLSEVTGNGFRITVDGGGQTPNTVNIFFQVYNA